MILELTPTNSEAQDARVRKRYGDKIDQLKELNFEYMCSYYAIMGDYSLIKLPHVYLLMRLSNNMVAIRNTFAICSIYPLLVDRNTSTYASISGFGVSFLTLFDDNSIIISADHAGPNMIDKSEDFYMYFKRMSIHDTYKTHLERIHTYRSTRKEVSFDNYTVICQKAKDIADSMGELPIAFMKALFLPLIILMAIAIILRIIAL